MPTIRAQSLGSDAVLRRAQHMPINGERLCEAILDGGTPQEVIGWIVRNRAGRLMFANATGQIRTLDQSKAEAEVAQWGGVHRTTRRRLHVRGAELRQLLVDTGYTQMSFARAWGVDGRTVRRWIADDQDIPPWVGKALGLMVRAGLMAGDLPE